MAPREIRKLTEREKEPESRRELAGRMSIDEDSCLWMLG